MSQDGTQSESSGIVIETGGARETLSHIFSYLDTLLPKTSIPSQPVWILASSWSLRQEIIRGIIDHRGTTLGIVVHTLHSASLTVLQRVHESLPEQNTLTDIWIRRESRKDPNLHTLLGSFDDEFAVVTKSVMDLLEAGISSTQEDALMECLSTMPAGPQRERAIALVKVALQVDRTLSTNGVTTTSGLAGHAAHWVATRPEQALECRDILVVGFTDTHAQGGDFLTALLRHANTRIYLDLPDDPAVPGRLESGHVYAQRSRERLLGAATHVENKRTVEPTHLDAFHAYGTHEEIREVARRIHTLLHDGVAPERIGIVARQLDPYMLPIRRHLLELGIPFGMQREPEGIYPLSRHFLAIQNLLDTGAETRTDDWLDALSPGDETLDWWKKDPGTATRADIREGLCLLGVKTLGEIPSLLARVAPNGALTLRSRDSRICEEAGVRSPHRQLPNTTLQKIAQSAQAFLDMPLQDESPLSMHLKVIRHVFIEILGWGNAPEGTSWVEAVDKLNDLDEFDSSFTRHEVLLLLEDATGGIAAPDNPGNRSGVRVMDATAARSLTFEHLFLVGMNRSAFPRVIKEDPLLPDSVRSQMLPILPDLAIKRHGHDEERFLFAQLLSASRNTSLSWLRCDHDGTEKARSVFIERLQIGDTKMPIADIPRDRATSLSQPFTGGLIKPRSARELALLGALTQPRSELSPLLTLTMAESLLRLHNKDEDATALAGIRLRILDEAEPVLSTKEGRKRAESPSPFLGFVGISPTEPEAPIYVTALEDLTRCPWQFFLKRVLRIEPPPESGRLPPALTKAMIGNVAHTTLEKLVEGVLSSHPGTVNKALSGATTTVERPPQDIVTKVLLESAQSVAYREGIYVEGLINMLVVLSLPLVMRFLDWDWPESDSQRQVYGTELEGHCLLTDHAGRSRTIAFKADRVEREGEKILFTDLKTGKPFADGIRETTRRNSLVDKTGKGGALQLLAYAASPTEASAARYLYGAENAPDVARELRIDDDDPLIQTTLESITSATVEAYDRGLHFPRLTQPNKNEKPKTCDWCTLREACAQGDSGARRRLQKIAGNSGLREEEGGDALFHHLWFYKGVDDGEVAS